MLATILKSDVATQVSIAIMDAFVHMRHYILENKDIYQSLNNINNKLIEIFFYIETSLNYIGAKVFSINRLEDDFIKKILLDYILEII